MNTKRYEIKDTISISVKNGILLVKIKNRKHQIWMSEKLYLVAFKRVKTFSENNTYFLLTSRIRSAKIHRLSLQTRGGKYLENQRSNNTQTLKILEISSSKEEQKSRSSGRENSEAQKCAAKNLITVIKEKQKLS